MLLSIVIAVGIKAEQAPSFAHVRRQGRGDVDSPAARMRKDDTPRMQMELVGYGDRQSFIAAVFVIADDRMTDMRHMGAQLMLPPRRRFKRYPGDYRRRLVDHAVMGNGALSAVLARLGGADAI